MTADSNQPMTVVVDGAKCSGHARCAAVGGEFWELDDLGYNAFSGDGRVDVPAQYRRQAIDGAAPCPERAITVGP